MNKEIIAFKRYEYLTKFMYQSGISGKGEWSSNTVVQQHKILDFMPPDKYNKILNLGESWREANIYKSLGYDCTGIVLPLDAVKELEEDGFKVIQQDMCNMIDIENESYDGIISIQALEHVFFPWKVLFEIYRVIKIGGRGIINVPVWYESEIYKDPPAHDLVNLQHVSILQPYQMKFMIRNSGFKMLWHDIHFNQQTIIFEKMSIKDIRDFSKDNPLSVYYNSNTASILEGYCTLK